MKIDELFETCEILNKESIAPIDSNDLLLSNIAEKVESVIDAKLTEFNNTVNTVETPPINNSGDNTANNDNVGDGAGNNNSANSSAESE